MSTLSLADHPALRQQDPWKTAINQAFRPRLISETAPTDERPPVTARFGEWMAQARPEFSWTARHFIHMQSVLDRVTTGEFRRVVFQVSIRHGKTEHNTVGYGAYRLEKDPRTRLIVASYNQRKADKFSRAIRKIARARGVLISDERDAASEWETVAGGEVRAVGAGTGVAGENADVIIIDDPLGSRVDAESQAKRDQVFDWISNDLLGRAEDHTVVLFTMSRWHKDDPAGRIIAGLAGKWELVDLPGRAEKDDVLGRKIGEPLWPEVRGERWHDEKRAEMNEYGYASQVQGRPRPREGGMFKTRWWQHLPEAPKAGRLIRYWDLAGTKKKADKKSHDPDWSAGALECRMPDERTALVHVARFRETPAVRDAKMVAIARTDVARYRNRGIEWWIETEAGIEGERRTADLVRKIQAVGMTTHTEHPTGSKELRAEPVASAAESGNFILGPDDEDEPWVDDFIAESADFPTGNHDDQIDGASGAYAKLADEPGEWGTSSFRM